MRGLLRDFADMVFVGRPSTGPARSHDAGLPKDGGAVLVGVLAQNDAKAPLAD
jgi:hypothetical protein